MCIRDRPYSELGREELLALQKELTLQYEDAKGKGLKLDMSRGKPASEQLDMTMPMMDIFNRDFDMRDEAGVDVRNYGYLEGIIGARRLLGEMLGVKPEQVIVFGTASLSAVSYTHLDVYKRQTMNIPTDMRIPMSTGVFRIFSISSIMQI